ncbi:GNAT family N-acetyltransferase [Alkalicoccobacillus porphyridii]|uniref:GNAT family N-acetyltransferase n=1 Tax=Alkalicoccobacillus porphyridii TaxID=2597270 RepID=A0A553ZZ16_9BACI|nr:GNAT family N-acetyltransferase [Alkalicoccobacillus porphyridii]TSB46697.1 GNAT family N-acetyltransferase [Alkalicoccobacillus porphyridii]
MNVRTWTIQIVSSQQELEHAYAVRQHVFVKEQGVAAELERDKEDANATHFVLYDQKTPSGAGRFRIIGSDAKIERVCIIKSLRGSGAGAALMQAIEQEAFAQGLQRVRLNAQLHASEFYHHLGYTTCSDEFMDAGIPHVTMEKMLATN